MAYILVSGTCWGLEPGETIEKSDLEDLDWRKLTIDKQWAVGETAVVVANGVVVNAVAFFVAVKSDSIRCLVVGCQNDSDEGGGASIKNEWICSPCLDMLRSGITTQCKHTFIAKLDNQLSMIRGVL